MCVSHGKLTNNHGIITAFSYCVCVVIAIRTLLKYRIEYTLAHVVLLTHSHSALMGTNGNKNLQPSIFQVHGTEVDQNHDIS
jgi:hypothetical protein